MENPQVAGFGFFLLLVSKHIGRSGHLQILYSIKKLLPLSVTFKRALRHVMK
jgi:hypothetical protein